MSTIESRCLDAFPEWLRSLSDDARSLAAVLESDASSEATRRRLAGALNYLFKSLDLIPDGIEDLGYIDDAFVFRVSCATALASDAGAGDADSSGALKRLAGEADLVREFLGDEFGRLEKYVGGLESGAARGRSVDDIISDAAVRADLVGDVKGWAESYAAPTFARDEKNLVKLKSFLAAKLPG